MQWASCHELGHALGLNHPKKPNGQEDLNDPSTCTSYAYPRGIPGASITPNAHDFEAIESVVDDHNDPPEESEGTEQSDLAHNGSESEYAYNGSMAGTYNNSEQPPSQPSNPDTQPSPNKPSPSDDGNNFTIFSWGLPASQLLHPVIGFELYVLETATSNLVADLTLDATQNQFAHILCEPGKSYTYYVAAFNDVDLGAFTSTSASCPVTRNLPPSGGGGLSVIPLNTGFGDSRLGLSWTNPLLGDPSHWGTLIQVTSGVEKEYYLVPRALTAVSVPCVNTSDAPRSYTVSIKWLWNTPQSLNLNGWSASASGTCLQDISSAEETVFFVLETADPFVQAALLLVDETVNETVPMLLGAALECVLNPSGGICKTVKDLGDSAVAAVICWVENDFKNLIGCL